MRFLRRSTDRYVKLGLRRKKNQKWRRPTGRDNKMREKRRGYPAVVGIGYKSSSEERGKIAEKIPVRINNLPELEKVGKENIIVLGKMGKKNKIEIVKKANERKLEIANLNIKKFLKENNKETKK